MEFQAVLFELHLMTLQIEFLFLFFILARDYSDLCTCLEINADKKHGIYTALSWKEKPNLWILRFIFLVKQIMFVKDSELFSIMAVLKYLQNKNYFNKGK